MERPLPEWLQINGHLQACNSWDDTVADETETMKNSNARTADLSLIPDRSQACSAAADFQNGHKQCTNLKDSGPLATCTGNLEGKMCNNINTPSFMVFKRMSKRIPHSFHLGHALIGHHA